MTRLRRVCPGFKSKIMIWWWKWIENLTIPSEIGLSDRKWTYWAVGADIEVLNNPKHDSDKIWSDLFITCPDATKLLILRWTVVTKLQKIETKWPSSRKQIKKANPSDNYVSGTDSVILNSCWFLSISLSDGVTISSNFWGLYRSKFGLRWRPNFKFPKSDWKSQSIR